MGRPRIKRAGPNLRNPNLDPATLNALKAREADKASAVNALAEVRVPRKIENVIERHKVRGKVDTQQQAPPKERFLLLYCKSFEGVPISDIPFLLVDEKGKSGVISARGVNFLTRDPCFYNDMCKFEYEINEKTKIMSQEEFFHFWASLNNSERQAFIQRAIASQDDKLNDKLYRYHESVNIRKLHRFLILIPHPIFGGTKQYYKDVEDYIASLPSYVERVTVGGNEVIADYLMTKYLLDGHVHEWDREKFRQQALRDITVMGKSDFSYHLTLKHLEPNNYWATDDNWSLDNHLGSDTFFYKFDYTITNSINESLMIPWEINKILTDEQRLEIRDLFFERIKYRIQSIKRETFGMDVVDVKTASYSDESLGGFLGFSGPFSDSERGD
jgi:hypothetical protein